MWFPVIFTSIGPCNFGETNVPSPTTPSNRLEPLDHSPDVPDGKEGEQTDITNHIVFQVSNKLFVQAECPKKFKNEREKLEYSSLHITNFSSSVIFQEFKSKFNSIDTML